MPKPKDPNQHPAKHSKSPNRVSLGFLALEELVERESFDEVNDIFIKAYEKLEKIAQAKGSTQNKKAAKKAMRSLELTMDLLRDFLQVKEDLIKQGYKPNT